MKHLTNAGFLQEIKHNQKPKRCLLYARAAARDPVTRKYYKALAKRRQTAFNAAFIDAYYPPRIIGVVLDYFSGRMGDPIIIRATDCFKVKEVQFEIYSSGGSLIEKGICCRQKNQKDFIYTVQKELFRLPGLRLKAIAIDIPMNKTCVERRI
ncbi:hypothetical protein [Flavihumibacter fluvii]|uniref:hypothetical protein n=1 Tax=Flavihumibacter fluvii TaxID=2838157 RepID=UPI001BDE4A39|nr:hypothetical protein [Flavihumibacter fluvii]ULQ52148.1 hypothetical protein KJS93_18820 [Flavihumibacter fluvii]